MAGVRYTHEAHSTTVLVELSGRRGPGADFGEVPPRKVPKGATLLATVAGGHVLPEPDQRIVVSSQSNAAVQNTTGAKPS